MGAALPDVQVQVCVILQLINHMHYWLIVCYEFMEPTELLRLTTL